MSNSCQEVLVVLETRYKDHKLSAKSSPAAKIKNELRCQRVAESKLRTYPTRVLLIKSRTLSVAKSKFISNRTLLEKTSR